MTDKHQTYISLGLMSGTSMDGIDAALIETDGKTSVREIARSALEYDRRFFALLKGAEGAMRKAGGDYDSARALFGDALRSSLADREKLDAAGVAAREKELAEFLFGPGAGQRKITFDAVISRSAELHFAAVSEVLRKAGVRAEEVDLIGYHGQTLLHMPGKRISIQAGDPQWLASQSGIPVVFHFRQNDVRSGGQGAPFAPLYHSARAVQSGLLPAVIANCGGISNLTILPRDESRICGYDAGPGNSLVDRFVQQRCGLPMDRDGALGANGRVSDVVLAELRQHAVRSFDGRNFLDLAPPKSLDTNELFLVPGLDALSVEDACRTLEAFTADCIVASLERAAPLVGEIPSEWVLAGGGWHNPVILAELEQRLRTALPSARVRAAEQVGWDAKALEAQLFAYLAVRSVRGLPLSMPGTTGVPKPLGGGELFFPAEDRARVSAKLGELLKTSGK